MEGIPSLEPPQGTDWLNELPEELLSTILGFLDTLTLCTARLVCKSFRYCAARHMKALRLDWTTKEKLPPTDFTQFTGVTYLAVTVSCERRLRSLAHPSIAPVITHVSLKGFHLGESQTAPEVEAVLMRLPKLRSMSIKPLVGDLHLPLFPPMLEELRITDRDMYCREQWEGVGDASPLTRCSQLTSLAIDLVVGAGPSMGSLSSLRNLRSLDLHSCSSALGPLSTLTSLTFKEKRSGEIGSIFQDLGRLTWLSRLALTRTERPRAVGHEDLTCIAQLTNLTCLDMRGCMLAHSAERSTGFSPLTRLVAVSFDGEKAGALVLSLRVNALHSLALWGVSGTKPLQRATSLTHLDLHCRISMYDSGVPGLCRVVARMSSLHSLSLSVHILEDEDPYEGPLFRLDAVLRSCTMLTKLEYGGWELRPERDLKACAALPGLRSLTFREIDNLTLAWLPALQAMSGLTELSLLNTGIRAADMTPDVIAAFDAERRQLGWPLLKLRVLSEWGGDCFERV